MHCTQELKEQLQAGNPAAPAAPKRARKAPRPAAAKAAASEAASEGSASDGAAGDEDDVDEAVHEDDDCAAAADPAAAGSDLGCPPAPKKVWLLHAFNVIVPSHHVLISACKRHATCMDDNTHASQS